MLILDEPTSGLDLFIRREFLSSMVDLAGAGRTILISSHGVAEVERVASHVAFLAEGRLLLAAPLEDLRRRIVRVRLRFDARRAGRRRARPGAGEARFPAGSGRRSCSTPTAPPWMPSRERPDLEGVEESPLTLEEMYTALLARYHTAGPPTASANGRAPHGRAGRRGVQAEGGRP